MPKIKIPGIPISEETECHEILDIIEEILTLMSRETDSFSPLLLLEPQPESEVASANASPSEAPEELIVVAIEQEVRNHCFKGLEQVEKYEPKYPQNIDSRTMKITPNTSFKSLFRKMTELPLTAFSLTLPDDGADAMTFFFLRTAFTISLFIQELQKPIVNQY